MKPLGLCFSKIQPFLLCNTMGPLQDAHLPTEAILPSDPSVNVGLWDPIHSTTGLRPLVEKGAWKFDSVYSTLVPERCGVIGKPRNTSQGCGRANYEHAGNPKSSREAGVILFSGSW